MSAELSKLADAVEDEIGFLNFVSELAEDWAEERRIEAENPSPSYGAGALGWENGSIGSFLDAAHAWGEATSEVTPYYEVPHNPWRRAAQILFAGKFCE